MDEDKQNIPADDSAEGDKQNAPPKAAKENVYDKIPLTVKQLDVIIAILLVAFVVFFVIGALKGNGII